MRAPSRRRRVVAPLLLTTLVGGVTALSASAPAGDPDPSATLTAHHVQGQALGFDAQRREQALSRDAAREPLEQAPRPSAADLRRFRAANARLDRANRSRSRELEQSRWVLPVDSYRLTGRFGASSSLWTTTHTGLDFAAPTGPPIRSITTGTVTEAGSAGAYGYRTIVRSPQGVEFWFCHQNSITVSAGDVVEPGQVIGEVGATGNVTGPHLHLEIRPGPQNPVDPEEALRQQGLSP